MSKSKSKSNTDSIHKLSCNGNTVTFKKSPYKSYWLHSGKPIPLTKCLNDLSNRDSITICSIDPGTVNFAMRIETRTFDGDITPLVFQKIYMKHNNDEYNTIVNNITNYLDSYLDTLKSCHLILIEEQLTFINHQSTDVAKYVIGYFHAQLRDVDSCPILLEVSSKLKGKMLDAPRGSDLKKWSPSKAKMILSEHGDGRSLNIFKYHNRKQDDLGDVVCQIEALLRYLEIGFVEEIDIDITKQ